MQSRLSPVTQFAIGRRQFSRPLCCDQTDDYVGPMTMIEFCREHHGGPHLLRVGAGKCADHDIAGLQRPSRSSCPNLSRAAAVASLRSSSDQESDHSMCPAPLRSASCCAQSSTFLASSGGSIRTALMSDSSLALRIMLSLFYAAVPQLGHPMPPRLNLGDAKIRTSFTLVRPPPSHDFRLINAVLVGVGAAVDL